MSASPSIPELAAVVYAKYRDLDTQASSLFHLCAEDRHAIRQLLEASVGPIYDGLRAALRSLDALEEVTNRSVARAKAAKEQANG